MDNDRGRRDGSFAEMQDYMRLIQALNVLHQEGGGPFEPLDLPANTRHLDIYQAQITLLDKSWQTQTLGHARTMDGIAMTTRPGLIRVDICPAQLSRHKADMVLCGNVGAHIATLLTAVPESAPIARTDQTARRSRGGRRWPRFGRSCRCNY